jgi:hypothetical protein
MHGWNLIGNPFGVTANIGKAFYRMNAAHTEIIVDSDNNIAPMEGIFVRATSSDESVTFTTGAKREDSDLEDRIVINLHSHLSPLTSNLSTSIIDRAIVSFDEGRTLPKFQIGNNSTKLYIPQNGEEYAIAYSDKTGEMPLNFVANENGEYTLTVSAPLNSNLSSLTLIDNLTGANIDLLSTSSYTFTAKNTDYPSRFRLVFSTNENENENFAFISNGELIVNGEGTLQVIDVLGHVLYSHEIHSDFCLLTSDFTAGVYVLQLVNGQNVKTQKIVIK